MNLSSERSRSFVHQLPICINPLWKLDCLLSLASQPKQIVCLAKDGLDSRFFRFIAQRFDGSFNHVSVSASRCLKALLTSLARKADETIPCFEIDLVELARCVHLDIDPQTMME
jgi:hypothetical protein